MIAELLQGYSINKMNTSFIVRTNGQKGQIVFHCYCEGEIEIRLLDLENLKKRIGAESVSVTGIYILDLDNNMFGITVNYKLPSSRTQLFNG